MDETTRFSDETIQFEYPASFTRVERDGRSDLVHEFEIRKVMLGGDEGSESLRQAARCFVRIEKPNASAEASESTLTVFLRHNVNLAYSVEPFLRAQDLSEEEVGRVHSRIWGNFRVDGTRTYSRNGKVVSEMDTKIRFVVLGQVSLVNNDPEPARRAVVDCYVPDFFEALAERMLDGIAGSIAPPS